MYVYICTHTRRHARNLAFCEGHLEKVTHLRVTLECRPATEEGGFWEGKRRNEANSVA